MKRLAGCLGYRKPANVSFQLFLKSRPACAQPLLFCTHLFFFGTILQRLEFYKCRAAPCALYAAAGEPQAGPVNPLCFPPLWGWAGPLEWPARGLAGPLGAATEEVMNGGSESGLSWDPNSVK